MDSLYEIEFEFNESASDIANNECGPSLQSNETSDEAQNCIKNQLIYESHQYQYDIPVEIYRKSSLFNLYTESDTDEDVIETFNNQFKEKQMHQNEIINLLFHHETIIFTKENVYKYVNFICFFCFDIMNELIEYVIYNYVLKEELLEYIYNIGSVHIKLVAIVQKQNVAFDKIVYMYRYIEEVASPNNQWKLTKNDDQICVVFADDYNKSTYIPNGINHLTFGYCYNQPTSVPNSDTHLTFGIHYDQPTSIPSSIQNLIHDSKRIQINSYHHLFKWIN